MKYWLMERNPDMVDDVKRATEIFKSFTHPASKCIICGENMNICSYCYIQEVLETLKEKDKRLIREFLQMYNFFV